MLCVGCAKADANKPNNTTRPSLGRIVKYVETTYSNKGLKERTLRLSTRGDERGMESKTEDKDVRFKYQIGLRRHPANGHAHSVYQKR